MRSFRCVRACLLLFQVSKLKLHEVDSQQQQPTQLQTFDADALRDVDTEKIQYEITIIEEQLNRMKPNMAAILEYKRKVESIYFACKLIKLHQMYKDLICLVCYRVDNATAYM
jgi:hypothetical protein